MNNPYGHYHRHNTPAAERMAALWKEVAREHVARSSSARQHARDCHDSMNAAVRRANKAESDAATYRADRDAAEEERDEAVQERDELRQTRRRLLGKVDQLEVKLRDSGGGGQAPALAAAEHRATRAEAQSAIRGRAVVIYRERAREAEAERDEWRQTALDERGAALDLLEQIKVRDKRIQAVLAVLGLEVGDA